MKPLSVYAILLASIVCQLVGMLMFAKGFFPYKPISTTFASHYDLPVLPLQEKEPRTSDGSSPIQPRFGRLVLMLVDALRSDFIFGSESNFTFVQSLVDENKALPFTALASAPTVTLPRLKALTTGTVPGFLDAVLNIAESDQSSTLANQDSWVAQWTRSRSAYDPSRNRTIGFFGDDTWIKLFPGQFFRSDGTSSFFAMDTVEVDVNVTRHVEPELAKDDWDALIFHYLGLDHVGHSGGPKSPLMRPKQAEMDQVARKIYTTIAAQDAQRKEGELPTLFILCGDHGMNEVGNHGGSSKSEISTAFIFASPLFELWGATALQEMINPHRQQNQPDEFQYYKTVNQVDLVPTLSLLMGNPIPRNSVGKLIPELLHGYSKHDTLRALQVNAHQVAHVLKGMWPSFQTEADSIPENRNDSDDESDLEACHRLKSDYDELGCLYSNAVVRHTSFLEMTMRSESSVHYRTADQTLVYHAANEAYSKFLSRASSMLSTALSKYDMALLTNGSLLMGFAVAGFLYCSIQTQTIGDLKASCQAPIVLSTSIDPTQSRPRTLGQAIQTLMTMSTEGKSIEYGRIKSKQRANLLDQWTATEVNWTMARILTAIILLLYIVTLFASSFVEEEHQFWYFFTMTWWLVLALISGQYIYEIKGDSKRPSTKAVMLCLAQMAVLRLLRAWNQTGQKYADEVDIRVYLNTSMKPLSWALFFLSMSTVTTVMIQTVLHRSTKGTDMEHQNHKAGQVVAAPSVEYMSFASVLQSLIVMAILSVSVWITVYKMDLEASFFGPELVDRLKRLLWFTKPLVAFSSSERGREMTGFEMARWSYAGLGFIILMSLILTKVDRRRLRTQTFLDGNGNIRQPQFLPIMIQGVCTLLTILLSRRHNAPLFVLFGLQLWLYLEWSKLIRVHGAQEDDGHAGKESLSVEYRDGAPEHMHVSIHQIQLTTIKRTPRYRSLPGLYSIHSTSVILWTMSSFFLMGNSNSIASIDIGNAYVGIRSYDIFLTGVLTFVSNWSGPLWWALAGTMLLVAGQDVELESRWLIHDAALRVAVDEESQWRSVTNWRKARHVETMPTRKRKVIMDKMVRDLKRRQKAEYQKLKSAAVAANEDTQSSIEPKGHAAVSTANQIMGTPFELPPDSTEINASARVSLEAVEPMRQAPTSDTFYIEEGEEEEIGDMQISSHTPDNNHEEGQITPRWIIENPRQFQSHLFLQRLVGHLVWTSTFMGLTLYALSIAAIILRHHLFIWTVFSPKVLYQMAWTVLFQTVAQVLFIPTLCLVVFFF